MGKFIDLTGKRFGRLTVVKMAGIRKKRIHWECLCDCGNKKNIISNSLNKGYTKSCGCLAIEKSTQRIKELTKSQKFKNHPSYKHGLTKNRIHRIWSNMFSRCTNKNIHSYKYYGKRGIKICPEWNKFENFYNDMGNEYKKNLTIDRIDNNGNYCKENCRWATYKTQGRNKRNNNLITYKGETMTLIDWSEELNINRTTLSSRINRSNWSIKKALETPVLNKK